MRLLCVCAHLRIGGAQRQWSTLLPGLAARGVEPVVLAMEEEGEFLWELRDGDIEARCARMRGRRDLRGWRRALRLADVGAGVVLSHGPGPQLVAAVIASRSRIPHATADHRAPGLPLQPHQEALVRLIAPRVDLAVAVTERQRPQLVRRRYRADRIVVIPNGVDARRLAPTRARSEIRAELGLGEGELGALLLSMLRPEKRPVDFVRAVARARRDGVPVRGIMAGDGPERAAVEAAVERLGAPVAVLGQRLDVGNLIAASDVVCVASAAESGPIAPMEAMALGRPIVATAVGGADEVVAHGETGFLVPPRDDAAMAAALARLAADPLLRRRLGAAGRRRQRTLFDAERMVESYAERLRGLARR